MLKQMRFVAIFIFLFLQCAQAMDDLTLMGRVIYSDGLCRIPIVVADMLKDLKINFLLHEYYELNNVPEHIKKLMLKDSRRVGRVLLYCDSLWTTDKDYTEKMPKTNINIAYSMLESTKIPAAWVTILNKKFDAVAVPDVFLVNVYKNSGVKIPIFTLPLGLYLDDFLSAPLKKIKNDPFVFGMSASFSEGKNHELLLDSFFETFGNNPRIKLLMHGRWGDQKIVAKINQKIKKNKITNVEIIQQIFNAEEYLEFMKKLDCYVLVSKGEGFSITPREAFALGLPCILSNNTAHKTICDSGFVYAVPCVDEEKAFYHGFGEEDCGVKFSCTQNDLSVALRYIYIHYKEALNKSLNRRQWAAQYSYKNVKKYFKNLIKPKKIVLGKINAIESDYLMTNSDILCQKYKTIL